MAEPKRHMDVPKERVLERSLHLGCYSQPTGWGPKKGTPNQGQKLSGLLDQHATTHLHMQRMAEPVAVVPVNPGLPAVKVTDAVC